MLGWCLQIGFLYLRYVLDPRTIWDWLQYYVKDHEVSNGEWSLVILVHVCRISAELLCALH
jgi:PRP38 family